MDSVEAPLPAASPAIVLLDAGAVLRAAAEPMRVALLRLVFAEPLLSVNDLAARLGRPADLVSKHLRVLREARMLISAADPDGDGRRQCHEIPAPFLSRDADGRPILDYGAVLLRL